jgi:hypothetical protein
LTKESGIVGVFRPYVNVSFHYASYSQRIEGQTGEKHDRLGEKTNSVDVKGRRSTGESRL